MFYCNEAKALGEKVWEGVSWKCLLGGLLARFLCSLVVVAAVLLQRQLGL